MRKIILPLLTTAMFASTSSFAADMKVSEFLKMNLEERVKICAQMVSSSDIGECAAIKSSAADIDPVKLASQARDCFSGKETDSHKIAQCVRAKMDEMKMPAEFPSKKHIEVAYNQCASVYGDSMQIGVCTAALCTKLDN